MNTTRTITISAQEIKKDKQTFIACSAQINGKWYKIKFTKDCERNPKTKGRYYLTINFDDCSFEAGKPYKKDGKERKSNDIIWVRKITDIKKYTDEELAEENRAEMASIFGAEMSEMTPEDYERF